MEGAGEGWAEPFKVRFWYIHKFALKQGKLLPDFIALISPPGNYIISAVEALRLCKPLSRNPSNTLS